MVVIHLIIVNVITLIKFFDSNIIRWSDHEKTVESLVDELRDSKIFKYEESTNTWTSIGRQFFASLDSPSEKSFDFLRSKDLQIQYDPNMKKLIVNTEYTRWNSPQLNALIYFPDQEMDFSTAIMKKVCSILWWRNRMV